MDYFNNIIELPTRYAIINMLDKGYLEFPDKIKELLKEIPTKLSFTVDCWTSKKKQKYIGIYMYFIRNNQLQYVTIDFIECEYEDCKSIKREFVRSIQKFGCLNRIMGLTTDNGKKHFNLGDGNSTFVTKLGKHFHQLNIPFSRETNWLQCINHVVNLAVQSIKFYILRFFTIQFRSN